MTMRKNNLIALLLGAVMAVSLVSCFSIKTGPVNEGFAESGYAEYKDKVVNGQPVKIGYKRQLGKLNVRTYTGEIIDGKYCELTVYNQELSGDGGFVAQVLDEENNLKVYAGNRFTLRGENDATIWQCKVSSGNKSLYFLCEADEVFWLKNDSTITKKYPLQRIDKHVFE